MHVSGQHGLLLYIFETGKSICNEHQFEVTAAGFILHNTDIATHLTVSVSAMSSNKHNYNTNVFGPGIVSASDAYIKTNYNENFLHVWSTQFPQILR